MSPKSLYKQFVSQFSLPEWKQLCKHRLFLHFLKKDLKIAASLAADALQRPVHYTFPSAEAAEKRPKQKPTKPSRRAGNSKFNHRRFRL